RRAERGFLPRPRRPRLCPREGPHPLSRDRSGLPGRRVHQGPVPRPLISGRVWAMATFIVTCPCCSGRLTIDPKLEAVVSHEPPPRAKPGLGLGEASSALQGAAANRAERLRDRRQAE